MTITQTVTTGLFAVAVFIAVQVVADQLRAWIARHARKPKAPTYAEAMAWGEKFEAMGQRAVTPHTLFIDRLREERSNTEEQISNVKTLLMELRRGEIAGETLPPGMRSEARFAFNQLSRQLGDLNEVIAEDERAGR